MCCRIVGIINHNQNAQEIEQTVVRMRDTMSYGGPDGTGFWADSKLNVAFGHRRLALIDLSAAGNQPMLNKHKTLCICFNGEIYNFKEIRKELVQKGYVFDSQSDTEVILAAFEEYNTKAFEKLNGMFAFALLDLQAKQVYLVRDSAGIKPMYYALQSHTLTFASEIRAFKASPVEYAEQPIWKSLFLSFGHLPEPYTTLKDVSILPKGNYLQYDLQKKTSKVQPFFSNQFVEKITDYKDAVQQVRESFILAVERHLIADAPVGIFMSGGVDSSLIALIADKILKKENNHTLSIVFKESKYSEKKYQEIVAAKLRNKHEYIEVSSEDFYRDFEDIRKAADQPSIDGINTYFISKFAKQSGLKAVLSGLGADELFGGYSTFKRATYLPYTSFLPPAVFKILSKLMQDKYKKAAFLALPNKLGTYLFFRGIFTPDMVARILGTTENEINSHLEKVFLGNQINTLSLGNQISWQEFNLYMQNQLLKDSDVMSMWHSLELRTPFLDKDFVSLAHNIGANTKFYSTSRTKELLLAAFDDILPQEIWNRPKQGFVFPFQEWLQKQSALLQIDENKNQTVQELAAQFKQGKLHWSRLWAIQQVL
jgi:asparagine synthase (glutamine-hydrolysing)